MKSDPGQLKSQELLYGACLGKGKYSREKENIPGKRKINIQDPNTKNTLGFVFQPTPYKTLRKTNKNKKL